MVEEKELSLEKILRQVEDRLRLIEIPGFDTNVIDSGVVTRIRISTDGEVLGVYVDYTGSDPMCWFCRVLNDHLWRRIVNDIYVAVKDMGFKKVYVIDERGGTVLAPRTYRLSYDHR